MAEKGKRGFASDFMADDWDAADDGAPPTTAPHPVQPIKNKWEGEDEDESTPASDWEDSSEEEEDEEEPKPAAPPPKKKGSLKAKLAEIEAAKAARAAAGDDDDDDDDEYDEDAVLDPREKARRDKEREISADLENTATLLGAARLGGSPSKELDDLLSADPRTKEDFHALSAQIIELVIKRHQDKPLYPAFIEHHVRQLAEPLKDVEVRKAASGLTTLANEKQKEQRDKASGKKKPKAISKPTLGAAKVSNKIDMAVYDEALDDFGKGAEDFM